MPVITRRMPKFVAGASEPPRAVFIVVRNASDPATRTIARTLRTAYPGAKVTARSDKITMRYTPGAQSSWNFVTINELHKAITGHERRTAHVALNLYGHRSYALDTSWELTVQDGLALETLGITATLLRCTQGTYAYDLLLPIANDLIDRKFIVHVLKAHPPRVDC